MNLKSIAKKIVRAPEKYNLHHVTKNKWPFCMRKKYAVLAYQLSTGRTMDLSNPTTFPEKIIWYKLYYKRDGLDKIVDKYQFKIHIEEKLGPGHTIPLLGAWDSVEAFRAGWANLPEEFCLKSNLMSDGKGIRMIHKRSEEDREEVCQFVADCLEPRNTLIHSFCYAYYKAKPMVIAEQYLEQVNHQLYDYKIFCFDGVPHCFYVATDHFPGQLSKISFYDLDWNKMTAQYGDHPNCDVGRPKHFDEMLKISKELSKEFPFVRVDFFDTDEKLYLAEMTFYPGGGLTLYKPEEFNQALGDKFRLPL